jgi:hypothetical protein
MLLVSSEHGHALWDFQGNHRPLLIRPVESRDLERGVALVQALITTLSPRNQSTRELTNLRELPQNDGERNPECDLVHERFNRLLDHNRIIVEHGLELRSDDLRNQHVMFPIHALDSEMIQECENASRSGV